jgi:hypothetical protein
MCVDVDQSRVRVDISPFGTNLLVFSLRGLAVQFGPF